MGYGRSMIWGAIAALLAVAVAVVAVVYFGPSRSRAAAGLGDRVLVMVASHGGQDESEVAQLIAVADDSSGKLTFTLVDPETSVTVPGTSAGTLRDSYPFGGAAGVASAYAAASKSAPLPAIAFDERAFEAIVDREGGVTVTVPAATNVFDGKRLFTFEAGERHVDGLEAAALLSATEYIGDTTERRAVRSAVATAVLDAVRGRVPQMSDLVAAGDVSSDMASDDVSAAGARFVRGVTAYTLSSATR